MTTDYWTIWRHIYDKWRIQKKFTVINANLYGITEGLDIANTEINRLLYIREKLLTDHPDRQDIDLRNRKVVTQVWQYLSKMQNLGEDVAKFSCKRVARDMGWEFNMLEDNGDDEDMWNQIGRFLIEQGMEGRIFIDPRDYYDHYSWCVEDFSGGKEISEEILQGFYNKFAQSTATTIDESTSNNNCETINCEQCSPSTEKCQCEETCLLCLPHTEGYTPISPISSLPSPPRTPGTQPLPSYFKGRRLSHPSTTTKLLLPEQVTDDDAVDILLSFSGVCTPPTKRRGRSRHLRVD